MTIEPIRAYWFQRGDMANGTRVYDACTNKLMLVYFEESTVNDRAPFEEMSLHMNRVARANNSNLTSKHRTKDIESRTVAWTRLPF